MEEGLPRLMLPYDVLADVLARLPPRSLAVSRCVCKEWRAIVDDDCCCQQLRSDLLPLKVGGIFIGSHAKETPDFFARPSSTARGSSSTRRVVNGRLESFVRMDDGELLGADFDDIEIADCCNGLLLLRQRELVVVNPATRRWACFPLPHYCCNDSFFLSPDDEAGIGFLYWSYEVISMQHPLNGERERTRLRGLQWPPSVYVMRAYSSITGRWEERRFALDGDDHEGIQNQRSTDGVSTRAYGHAAYWRGVLYVHCNSHFILRINLSDNKYQVINLPADANGCGDCQVYLGKSKNGIYFAAVIHDTCRLLVWFLDESDGKAQWVLKHGINQHALITHIWDSASARTDRPWILQKDGYSHQECKLENNSDWDSDDENSAVEIKEDCNTAENAYGPIIFGFHPYKEIVFLHSSRVVAYDFSRSKVQDLGDLGYIPPDQMIRRAFVYAPCWVGELSESDHS